MDITEELSAVMKMLEALADEQAAAGQLRWSGMTLTARQTIRVLIKSTPPSAETTEEPTQAP